MAENKETCSCMTVCDFLNKLKEEEKPNFNIGNLNLLCCCCCGKGDNSGGKDPQPGPGDGNECQWGDECTCDDCKCKDCEHGGGKDPDPNPGDSCQCGDDCDCDDCKCKDCEHGGGKDPDPDPGDDDDPHGELDPSKPGLPLKGEPTNLYVTPNFNNAGSFIFTERYLWWESEDGNPDFSTSDGGSGLITIAGKTTAEFTGYFKRYQYVTAYQLIVTGSSGDVSIANSPRKWKLSLSSDNGNTWKYTDEREYINWLDADRQTWDVPAGYYNAYKFEVLTNNGGNKVCTHAVKLIGLPTEIFPVIFNAFGGRAGHGLSLHGHQVASLSLSAITAPYHYTSSNPGHLDIYPTGYVDYVFKEPRKARSFSICAYTGSANSYEPFKSWKILGSNDGDNWDLLFSSEDTDLPNNEEVFYNLDKVAFYRQYRLMPLHNSNKVGIFYFQLYRTGTPTDPSHPYEVRVPGEEYDPRDPGDTVIPGLPLKGETQCVYVSPNAHTSNSRWTDWRTCLNKWYLWGAQSDGATDAEDTMGVSGSWKTPVGQTSGSFEIYFRKMQYMTGYEINSQLTGQTTIPTTDLPLKWNFYVSSDHGENWQLDHSMTHEWREDEKNIHSINPGFYNAYKFEVLSVFGGNRVQMGPLNVIGVPTETIFLQDTGAGHNWDGIIAKKNTDYPNHLTWPTAQTAAYISAVGFVDYSYIDKRKARSFSIVPYTDLMTGWEVLGSNDGINWDTLFSIENQELVPGEEYTYSLNKTSLYRRYRLKPTQYKSGTTATLTYFQLYR